MRYAQIENGLIKKIYNIKPNWYSGDPDTGGELLTDEQLLELGVYPIETDLSLYDVNKTRYEINDESQWIIDDVNKKVVATVTITTLTPEEIKARILNDVNSRARMAVDSGTILGDETPIRTNNLAQSRITQAKLSATANPSLVINNWKLEDGTFISINADKINEMYDAIFSHVQSCFNNESVIVGQINAINLNDSDAIDQLLAIDIDAGW